MRLYGGTAAEVAGHRQPCLIFGRGRQPVEQRLGRHDLPRCAEPALEATVLGERLLDRVQGIVFCHALDRQDARAGGLHGELRARIHAAAVNDDRARATLHAIAPHLGAGERQVVAEQFEERRVVGDGNAIGRPIDRERDGGPSRIESGRFRKLCVGRARQYRGRQRSSRDGSTFEKRAPRDRTLVVLVFSHGSRSQNPAVS